MSETLKKLLLVYIGVEDQNTMPEVCDFEYFLREKYHHGDIEHWAQTYEDMTREFPNDPVICFDVVKVCMVWIEELEKEYSSSRPEHNPSLEEWMNTKDLTYKGFISLRYKAAYYLDKIIQMTPELPIDIVAAILADIYNLRYIP
jgi:hypothetical protein